jgi:glycosyltransferase involved in cell wall biosynthesis
MAIVSSYGRPCGIAQYLESIEPVLRDRSGFDVEIMPLPVDLLRAQLPHAKKAAAKAMREIVRKAAQSDLTCIEFEPGLFGMTPRTIWRNARALIRASRRVLIVYHTAPSIQGGLPSFSLKGIFGYLKARLRQSVFDNLFGYVRAHPEKFRHLVHTAREARNFEMFGIRRDTILRAPLSFIDAPERERLAARRPALQDSARARYTLPPDAKILGCFGFLSPYKGIEVAIQTMKHLPDNYHLLVVGGFHPEGIQPGAVQQAYMAVLMKALTRPLLSRVHFCGALENERFNEVMAACDAVILPYAEVGQTSSGPASLALDMQLPVYASNNLFFREMNKYRPGVLTFFEIGNHLELAEKILRDAGAECAEARKAYLEEYNVRSRAQLYWNAFDDLLRSKA